MFLHCRQCIDELPEDISPQEYVNNEIEVREDLTVIIRCIRHQSEVCHFKIDPNDAFARIMRGEKCNCGKCGKPIGKEVTH